MNSTTKRLKGDENLGSDTQAKVSGAREDSGHPQKDSCPQTVGEIIWRQGGHRPQADGGNCGDVLVPPCFILKGTLGSRWGQPRAIHHKVLNSVPNLCHCSQAVVSVLHTMPFSKVTGINNSKIYWSSYLYTPHLVHCAQIDDVAVGCDRGS